MSLSVDAKYGSDEIFDNCELRLATRISERNVIFSDELARYGQALRFSTSRDPAQADDDLPPALSWDTVDGVSSKPEATFEVRRLTDCQED